MQAQLVPAPDSSDSTVDAPNGAQRFDGCRYWGASKLDAISSSTQAFLQVSCGPLHCWLCVQLGPF